MELSNKTFELIENQNGLADSSTRMIFNKNSAPYEATYSGPNVSNGHVLAFKVNDSFNMVYHALTQQGELVAGKAQVQLVRKDLGNLEMQLNWQWLTGELSSGISRWEEVNA